MNRIGNDVSGTDQSAHGTTECSQIERLRPLLLSASFVLAFAAAPVGAIEEHHPEPSGSNPAGVASATQAVGQTVEKMQENARKMQSQLDRIGAAKTDEERRDALVEHMRTTQENMVMGRNMMMGAAGDCSMMGPGGSGGADPAAMERRERRLDMMQMMMEQMIRARQAQPRAAPSMPGQ